MRIIITGYNTRAAHRHPSVRLPSIHLTDLLYYFNSINRFNIKKKKKKKTQTESTLSNAYVSHEMRVYFKVFFKVYFLSVFFFKRNGSVPSATERSGRWDYNFGENTFQSRVIIFSSSFAFVVVVLDDCLLCSSLYGIDGYLFFCFVFAQFSAGARRRSSICINKMTMMMT